MRESQAGADRPATPYGQNRDTQPIVGHNDGYGAKSYTDPLNPDVRPSTATNVRLQEDELEPNAAVAAAGPKKKVKKVLLLPWWCTIVAWVALFCTLGVSVAIVTFYGIQFQNEQCTKWLTSLLISFFSSVLLTQPVKVLFFALLFAFLFKKPIDDDIDEEALESQDVVLQSGETWLHDSSSYGNRTYMS